MDTAMPGDKTVWAVALTYPILRHMKANWYKLHFTNNITSKSNLQDQKVDTHGLTPVILSTDFDTVIAERVKGELCSSWEYGFGYVLEII